MAKDYYGTLGVGRDATREDIKKAYKRLAKEYHPDLNKSPEAEQRFKEINEAAATLGDEEKRRQYDQVGHDAFTGAQRGGAGAGGFSGYDFSGADFDDIFESFFSGGFGDIFGGGGRRAPRRGADLRYDLEITLKEAAFGVKKSVAMKKRAECKACGGKGGKKVETCTTCHGTGSVRRQQRTPFGVFQTASPCPACGGTGSRVAERCEECAGAGVVMAKRELEIEIPAGVETGSRLRVTGEGEAAGKGGRPGDLYVFISVAPHELFEREGTDVILEAPVSFVQAVFGDEIEVPTLDGRARLKLPAGTQSGTVFRLREKGILHLNGRGRGDELVRVQVVTPTKLSKRQEELLRKLADESGEGAKLQKSLFDKLREHLR